METVLSLVTKINDLLWNSVLLVLLCGTGIYFTIRLKFIQVRKLGEGMKLVFGNIHLKDYKKKEGEMSPFQGRCPHSKRWQLPLQHKLELVT